MKITEFRKIIREEVRKIVKEEVSTVAIQIADEEDGFEYPDGYQLPKVIQSIVGDFNPSADPEDDSEFDYELDQYLAKIQKALLAAGKKVIPDLQKYAQEDGFIYLKTSQKITPQIQAKLKALYKGAKSIEF